MGKASKKDQGPPRVVEPMMMNLHNRGCFSNCNLRMHHAMVTGTHLLKEKMLRVFILLTLHSNITIRCISCKLKCNHIENAQKSHYDFIHVSGYIPESTCVYGTVAVAIEASSQMLLYNCLVVNMLPQLNTAEITVI